MAGSQLLGMWVGEGADPLDCTSSDLANRKSPILEVRGNECVCAGVCMLVCVCLCVYVCMCMCVDVCFAVAKDITVFRQ